MLNDAGAVRAIREREVKHLRVAFALLEAFRGDPVLAFRLYDGKLKHRIELEQVVRAQRLVAPMTASHADDASIGDRILLDDLVSRPTRFAQSGQHVFAAGIRFERSPRAHLAGMVREDRHESVNMADSLSSDLPVFVTDATMRSR